MKRLLCAGLLLTASFAAWAQRDPTTPPLMGGGESGGGSGVRANADVWPVIYVNGRPHVAVGARLYAEGQMLGKTRIERITETEIWLREGATLRKVQNYPSVQRRSTESAQSR